MTAHTGRFVIGFERVDNTELDLTGDRPDAESRYKLERTVQADPHTDEARDALRMLRARGVDVGMLRGDTLPPIPGSTKRGIPPDYAGDDPHLCNARTKSGKPCRAMKLKGGRCKWHGGLSTGPRTPEGKARCAINLRRRKDEQSSEK